MSDEEDMIPIAAFEEEAYFRHEAEGQNEHLRLDNAALRKQILAYQKDLALCRRILYWLSSNTVGDVKKIADRCIKELKQK